MKVNINVFLTLRDQKRMYSNDMKENERTKEIHIAEREGKNIHVYIVD